MSCYNSYSLQRPGTTYFIGKVNLYKGQKGKEVNETSCKQREKINLMIGQKNKTHKQTQKENGGQTCYVLTGLNSRSCAVFPLFRTSQN